MDDLNQDSLEGLESAFSSQGIRPLGSSETGMNDETVTQRRRAFFHREESPFTQLSLIKGPDGALRWHDGAPGLFHATARRRTARAAVPAGTIEKQFVFEKLHDSSQVNSALLTLDDKLTDSSRRELWRWAKNGWVPFNPGAAAIPAKPKILLFIHGTFSHCDKIFEDLDSTPEGRAFLTSALGKYDLILGFNHPTLSVSPAVNAFTLASYLRGIKGPPEKIDVICHSRGGLVTRWWLEGFAAPGVDYRAIYVAAPLGGTNLASPPRLKGAFDFLTNVANALGTEGTMAGFPLLQFVGGLMKILSSVARVGIHSPALHAAVAAIPGLAAQSRVGNNPELLGLRTAGAWKNYPYFAVLSDFRPPVIEKWKFWKIFCDPAQFALNWADEATDLVFVDRKTPGAPLELSPNDLIVDCASMTDLADGVMVGNFKDALDFGQSSTVMHTNYFKEKKTLEFIAKVLGW